MSSQLLILMRHAKSSWKDESLNDTDRPLNKRGRRDAPEMGRRLKERGIHSDLIVSSPAVRALTTAETVADQLGYGPDRIVVTDSLYAAATEDIFDVVIRFSADVKTAIVVTHNPVITELANHFSTSDIDNVPTSGVLFVEVSNWQEIERSGRLVDFDYPKNIKA